MKEIAGALMNLPKLADAIAIAFNSPTVQRRLQLGASADVRYVMEKSEFLPTFFMRAARMGMLPLNWGDALLTSVSAGISYRAAFIEAKKMGMLDAAANDYALDKMDSSVYRFSQPAGVFNRSLTENTGNAWFRAFMLFMSDPRLKTAIILEQVQNIKQGKNVGTAVRGIIAIEVMAVVAQTIVNAYRDLFTEADEEDLWTIGRLCARHALRSSGRPAWHRRSHRRRIVLVDGEQIPEVEPRSFRRNDRADFATPQARRALLQPGGSAGFPESPERPGEDLHAPHFHLRATRCAHPSDRRRGHKSPASARGSS